MNAEAELHRQLTAIDPRYTIVLDNRIWTCTVKAGSDGEAHPIVFVHLGKLQAMDGGLKRARRVIAENEIKEI